MRILGRFVGGYRELTWCLACRRAKKIVIGSAGASIPGWFSTTRETLDVCNRKSFSRYWRPGTRWAFLAEHVWEHLEPDEAEVATANCFEFLVSGGRLRLATPDGLHPDPEYLERVRPGGRGDGAADHKVLYNFKTCKELLEKGGFEVVPLEYWDDRGRFHSTEWSPEEGPVRRSSQYDSRNLLSPLVYTSLIVDGIKP